MWPALKTRLLPDPETVTTLDVEDARDIVLRSDDTLFFFELTKISEAVASILVRYGDDLWLGKLASLTPGVSRWRAATLGRRSRRAALESAGPPRCRPPMPVSRTATPAAPREHRPSHQTGP